jgi:hypothetical protein
VRGRIFSNFYDYMHYRLCCFFHILAHKLTNLDFSISQSLVRWSVLIVLNNPLLYTHTYIYLFISIFSFLPKGEEE